MTAVTIPSITGGIAEAYPADSPITVAVKSGETITGGRLVELTASKEVKHATASSLKVLGVALHDGDAAGDITKVTVAPCGYWRLTASGAISAGDKLVADTGGKVKTMTASGMPAANTYATASANTAENEGRAVIGIAIEDIADTATGIVLLTIC